jgi:hypothetical protein
MLYILLLLFLFSNCVICDNNGEKNEKNDINENIKKGAMATVAPEITSALEIAKMLKTTSETSISDIKQSTGFLELGIKLKYETGDNYRKDLKNIIESCIDSVDQFSLPKNLKMSIANSLHQKENSLISIKNTIQHYDFTFFDGRGTLYLMHFEFAPHPHIDNAIIWSKYILSSQSKPAPPYIIVSSSDCDIFSCDTEQHIEYLPAVFTENHMTELLNMNAKLMISLDSNKKQIAQQ